MSKLNKTPQNTKHRKKINVTHILELNDPFFFSEFRYFGFIGHSYVSYQPKNKNQIPNDYILCQPINDLSHPIIDLSQNDVIPLLPMDSIKTSQISDYWGYLPLYYIGLGLYRNIRPSFGDHVIFAGNSILNHPVHDLFTKGGCFSKTFFHSPVEIDELIQKIEDISEDWPFIDLLIITDPELNETCLKTISTNQKLQEKIGKIGVLPWNLRNGVQWNQIHPKVNVLQYSYPGEKDPLYQKGIPYPYNYVRWDKFRNLELLVHWFTDLKVDFTSLPKIFLKEEQKGRKKYTIQKTHK